MCWLVFAPRPVSSCRFPPYRFLGIGALLAGVLPELRAPAMAQYLLGPALTSSRMPVAWEHNMLFNATERYTVMQTGAAQVALNMMFDGDAHPDYPAAGPSPTEPTVITITDIPRHFRQAGDWVGWTTRYWPVKHFKIELYNTSGGANEWITVADLSPSQAPYDDYHYATKISNSSRIYTGVRFTFYEGTDGNIGTNGLRRIGLSELFYINPEGGRPYQGLLPKSMGSVGGNVGIGVRNPGPDRLAINGSIRSKEVTVTDVGWADYVFDDDYSLRPLTAVEQFIEANGHLPDVPSAAEVATGGLQVGETQATLLRKIEELTLYAITSRKQSRRRRRR